MPRRQRTQRRNTNDERIGFPPKARQDDWIKARLANGDYTNDSEYLRDLIRREQEKAAALKAAIDEGLTSGPSDRSLDDIWADAEARYRASNG